MEIGKYIGEAWDLTKDNLGTFVVAFLIIAIAGNIVPIVLSAPLTVGFYVIASKAKKGEADLGDLAKGFDVFGSTVLAQLVRAILIVVGLIFCILPGLVFALWYMYTLVVIAEKKVGFQEAMKESKEIVSKEFFDHVIFVIVLFFINFIGFLLCVVGLLVTVPLSMTALVMAYQDLKPE
ncbi:MAG: hypothetical protein ACE5HW_02185 [Candidatus Methanofastidiosia archaeon]